MLKTISALKVYTITFLYVMLFLNRNVDCFNKLTEEKSSRANKNYSRVKLIFLKFL